MINVPDDLDNLVLAAQQGDAAAMADLLARFGYREGQEPTHFLGKYYRILRRGSIDLRDRNTRRFLQLYIPDGQIRELLGYNKQNPFVRQSVQQTADYLQEHFERICDEDLRQDLVLLFLRCVMGFKKISDKITFAGYLANTYHYAVFRYYHKQLFADDLTNRFVCSPLVEDETEDWFARIEPKEYWGDRFYETEAKAGNLGIFWINGRCSDVFKPLSTFQRTLLRDHDFYNLTDREIGEKYGLHINTVFKQRTLAKQALAESIKKEQIL